MKFITKTMSIATLITSVTLATTAIAAKEPAKPVAEMAKTQVLKVGYVSTQKVMSELAKKMGLQKKLETEFAARIEEVKAIQTSLQSTVENLKKNGATMKPEQQTDLQRKAENFNSTLQLKGKALQEDQRKRAAEEENKMIDKVKKAIDAVAKAEKYDLIVDGQVVLFAGSNTEDLSDKILAAIK